MSTIFDHYFAVLFFHCSKIPPWSFKDQQISLCRNLGKCGRNPDSAHNNVKVPVDLYHTTIINEHGDSMYIWFTLAETKIYLKKYRSNLTQNSFKVQKFVALVVELHKLLQYLSFCLFLVTLGKVKILLKELNLGIYVNEAMLWNLPPYAQIAFYSMFCILGKRIIIWRMAGLKLFFINECCVWVSESGTYENYLETERAKRKSGEVTLW